MGSTFRTAARNTFSLFTFHFHENYIDCLKNVKIYEKKITEQEQKKMHYFMWTTEESRTYTILEIWEDE
jgi:hypothetical protein